MNPYGPQAYFHGPPSEPQKRKPIPPSPLGQPMPPKSTGNQIHWEPNPLGYKSTENQCSRNQSPQTSCGNECLGSKALGKNALQL